MARQQIAAGALVSHMARQQIAAGALVSHMARQQIAAGALVSLPRLKLEAVVEEVGENGPRVQIVGPMLNHELFGASMWVAPDDIKALPVPKALPDAFEVGSIVHARLSEQGLERATVLDIRQGLRRGPSGLRIRVVAASGEHDAMWLHHADIDQGEQDGESVNQPRDASFLHGDGMPSRMAPSSTVRDPEGASTSAEATTEFEDWEAPGNTEVDEHATGDAAEKTFEEQTTDEDEEECDTEEASLRAAHAADASASDAGDAMVGEEREDAEESGDDEDEEEEEEGCEYEENDAVVVQWGIRRGVTRDYNAVVSELRPRQRGPSVRVQFDAGGKHAWLSHTAVRLMPEAALETLPSWAHPEAPIEAVDPVSGDRRTWHPATVVEVRRGVAEASEGGGRGDDGVRLWVRYSVSQLCQWLRLSDIREAGVHRASPAAHDADGSDGATRDRVVQRPSKRARVARTPPSQPLAGALAGASKPRARRARGANGRASGAHEPGSATTAHAPAESAAAAVAVRGGRSRRAESARACQRDHSSSLTDRAAAGDAAEKTFEEQSADEDEEECDTEEASLRAAHAADASASDAGDAMVGEEREDAEESGDDEDEEEEEEGCEYEENDAVVVQWGIRRGVTRDYNAVVSELRPRQRGPSVRVQFDAGGKHAWLSHTAVRLMPEAALETLPSWAHPEAPIEAVDPVSGDRRTWHPATVVEVRRGVAEASEGGGRGDDGVRLWVRYSVSQLCQWLRLSDIREAGVHRASPAAHDADGSDGATRDRVVQRPSKRARSAAPYEGRSQGNSASRHWRSAPSEAAHPQVLRLSRACGYPGDEVWVLLASPLAGVPAQQLTPRVLLGGENAANVQLITPTVLSFTVPRDAAAGRAEVQVVDHGTRRERTAAGTLTGDSQQPRSREVDNPTSTPTSSVACPHAKPPGRGLPTICFEVMAVE